MYLEAGSAAGGGWGAAGRGRGAAGGGRGAAGGGWGAAGGGKLGWCVSGPGRRAAELPTPGASDIGGFIWKSKVCDWGGPVGGSAGFGFCGMSMMDVPGTTFGRLGFRFFELPLARAWPDLQRRIRFEHRRCNRIERRTWKQQAGARQTVPPQQRDIKWQ